MDYYIKKFTALYRRHYNKILSSRFNCNNDLVKWKSQFDCSYGKLLDYLLKHYNFYNYEAIVKRCKELFVKICKNNIDIEKTLFLSTAFKEENKFHFSYIFFTLFLIKNQIFHEKYYTNDINSYIKNNNISYVVIIDDCSGSGNNIKNCLNCIVNNNLIIYIAVLDLYPCAKNNIDRYCKQNSIEYKIICVSEHKRAFDYCSFSVNALGYKEKYRGLYLTKCEALLSYYYNTPNITLGLFWKQKSEYLPLYRRIFRDEKMTLRLIKQITQRPNFTNSNKINRIIDDSMLFICCFHNEFLFALMNVLGVSAKKVFSRLFELASNGYLFFDDVNFKLCGTCKLNSLLAKYKKELLNYFNELELSDSNSEDDNYFSSSVYNSIMCKNNPSI